MDPPEKKMHPLLWVGILWIAVSVMGDRYHKWTTPRKPTPAAYFQQIRETDQRLLHEKMQDPEWRQQQSLDAIESELRQIREKISH
jgi:hypothetical protein